MASTPVVARLGCLAAGRERWPENSKMASRAYVRKLFSLLLRTLGGIHHQSPESLFLCFKGNMSIVLPWFLGSIALCIFESSC